MPSTTRKVTWWHITAAAIAIAATAVIVLRPSDTILPITILGEATQGCAEVRVGDITPQSFFLERLRTARLTDDEAGFVVAYLSASLSGCERNVAGLRDQALNEEVINTARDAAVRFDPEWRPTPETLSSPSELAVWWLGLSEPWAWVDRSTLSVVVTDWNAFEGRLRAYLEEWSERRRRAIAFPPTMYESPFGTFGAVPEAEKASARILCIGVVFGVRESAHEGVPLSLEVCFWLRPNDDPRVLAVMLRGNRSALWRNLAL